MAQNLTLYTPFLLGLGQGLHNLANDTMQAVLLTNSYVPDTIAHATWADISAFEVAGASGYAAGGQSITGKTWTQQGNTVLWSLQSVLWPGSTITAKYVAIVRRSGVALVNGDRLVGYRQLKDDGTDGVTAGATFQVNFNGSSASAANTGFTFTHTP